MYELEQLKLNEVKIMCPLIIINENLSIHFKFDGIIEIISEDKDIEMFINPNNLLEPIRGSNINEPHGFDMKLTFEGYIAANPLGSNTGHMWVDDGINGLPHFVGREYYLNVNAYKFDNEQSPVIKAQLKFVQLEDKTLTGGEFASACFSIELVSYEYSDMYRVMDEIWEDEDE